MGLKARIISIDFDKQVATVLFTEYNPLAEEEMVLFREQLKEDTEATQILGDLTSFKKQINIPYKDGNIDNDELLTRIDSHGRTLQIRATTWTETLKSKTVMIPNLENLAQTEYDLPSRS